MFTLGRDDDQGTNMASPFTADQFVTILRAEGVRVVEYRSWRTHNRNHKGPWGPVYGTMLHHTAGWPAGAVDYCYEGSAELPGPLCHGVITKDGTVYLVGNGRTNHAGGGDPVVLDQVINESYDIAPDPPTKGNATGIDGNAHFYGFECVNLGDGKDPWPEAQVEAMVRVSAAISRAKLWSAKSAIGHKEWSRDKSDPRGSGDVVIMPRLRGKITERLAHSASWNPDTPVPPTQGQDMANLTRLSRTTDVTIVPDGAYTIYWEAEQVDEPNQHGAGGKTVLTSAKYNAVLNLVFDGLTEVDYVEVHPVEEDGNGLQVAQGDSSHVWGRADSPAIQENVAIVGSAVQRLAFQVINRGDSVVTLASARLQMLSWPV